MTDQTKDQREGNLEGFASRLARSRNRSLDHEANMESFAIRCFSGTVYSLWCAAEAMTQRVSCGLTLDAGSGRGGWACVITRDGERESVDIAPKDGDAVTHIADLQRMPQIPNERYDGVVCHQVLEHLPSPALAVAELNRVLRSGGLAVISVPHLSRLHELPHDYYRFTQYGLKKLLEDAGFEVIELTHFGGVICFLHHQFATLFAALFDLLPFGPKIFAFLNAPLSVLARAIDSLTDRRGLLANGVIALARKPGAHERNEP